MPGERILRSGSVDTRITGPGNSNKSGSDRNKSPERVNKQHRLLEERRKRCKSNIGRLGDEANSDAIKKMTMTQLTDRIGKLAQIWTQYEDTHVSLVAEADNTDDVTAYDVEYDTVDDMVTKYKDKISAQIDSLNVARDTAAAQAGTATDANRSGVTIITGDGLNNIPNTWGKFTGEHDKWHTFRDCFENAIHTNDQLEPIKKFQYLIAALDGAARKTVTQLKFTAANYTAAWDRLKETYEDNYTATRQLMRGLLELPRVKHPSTEALRNIVDSVHYALAQLGNFVKVNDWDNWIAFLILSRLDGQTLRAWEAYRSSKLCSTTAEANRMIPTWPQVKEFLDQRARILMAAPEEMEVDLNGGELSSGARKHSRSGGRHRPAPYPNEKPITSSNNGNKPRYPMCRLCDIAHPMFHCQKFTKGMNLKSRIEYVKKNNICFGCLKELTPNHECRQLPCNKCQDGKRHSSYLCPTKEAEVQTALMTAEAQSKPNKPVVKRAGGQNKE